MACSIVMLFLLFLRLAHRLAQRRDTQLHTVIGDGSVLHERPQFHADVQQEREDNQCTDNLDGVNQMGIDNSG